MTEGPLGLLAKLIVFATILCVRWAHLPRCGQITVTGASMKGTVSRGKRRVAGNRPSFDWNVVRFCPHSVDMLGPLETL